jgi:hypothetical protein
LLQYTSVCCEQMWPTTLASCVCKVRECMINCQLV